MMEMLIKNLSWQLAPIQTNAVVPHPVAKGGAPGRRLWWQRLRERLNTSADCKHRRGDEGQELDDRVLRAISGVVRRTRACGSTADRLTPSRELGLSCARASWSRGSWLLCC